MENNRDYRRGKLMTHSELQKERIHTEIIEL